MGYIFERDVFKQKVHRITQKIIEKVRIFE